MRLTGPERSRSAQAPRQADDKELLRWCREVVAAVGSFEAEMRALDDSDFPALTESLRTRLAAGGTLDSLLPEAFAAVREAASRALGQRPYDVQIMGGAVLHAGRIAEMLTGEGKTLTATLPAYLNALTGDGVHVMTASRYLARRDAEWMAPVYRFLGLQAGLSEEDPDEGKRRRAYSADVTYGSYLNFAYDYLRDNVYWHSQDRVQRGLHLAIVDEADLILVDEARATPQLTKAAESGTGPAVPSATHPAVFAELAAQMQSGLHYDADSSRKFASLTDDGTRLVEDALDIADGGGLYDERFQPIIRYVQNALIAKEFYRKDRDYIVKDDRIVVLDGASGRPLHERRYPDGLHAAIEAKEGLAVREEAEPETVAIIPVWDYLSQYQRLCGMTGSAMTEAETYRRVYGLDVVTIPTNRPMIRVDHRDRLYRTAAAKLDAIAADTAKRHAAGQPVLIGAMSIQQADSISQLLARQDIAHEVLTARNDEREAAVIAGAARLRAVTVVARMAGRGVDIVLGGGDAAEREAVANRGGLYVIGTERSIERRVELLLRGRAGRQGDPGESRFFMSLEDELLAPNTRVKEAMNNVIRRFGEEGDEIPKMAMRVMDRWQARTAAGTAAWLEKVLEYDRVLAEQQHAVYAERREIVDSPEARRKLVQGMISEVFSADALPDVRERYQRREQAIGSATMRELEKRVTLNIVDQAWRAHLPAMQDLLRVIHARSAGGAAPLPDYRREAAELFSAMRTRVRKQIVRSLLTMSLSDELLQQLRSYSADH